MNTKKTVWKKPKLRCLRDEINILFSKRSYSAFVKSKFNGKLNYEPAVACIDVEQDKIIYWGMDAHCAS